MFKYNSVAIGGHGTAMAAQRCWRQCYRYGRSVMLETMAVAIGRRVIQGVEICSVEDCCHSGTSATHSTAILSIGAQGLTTRKPLGPLGRPQF